MSTAAGRQLAYRCAQLLLARTAMSDTCAWDRQLLAGALIYLRSQNLFPPGAVGAWAGACGPTLHTAFTACRVDSPVLCKL